MITIENVKSKIEDLKEQKLEFINEEESEKILLREGFYFIDKYKSIFLKNYLVSEEYQDDTLGAGVVVEVVRAGDLHGLDRIFREAGFEWRDPGCSMCLAMNADRLEPGE